MDRFELKITLGICSIFLLCCQSLALSNGPRYLQNFTKSCYGDFMLLSPTGAGPKTSRSTGQIGVKASQFLANLDLAAIKQYWDKIMTPANAVCLDPALIAALASRESNVGKSLCSGWGDCRFGKCKGCRAWGILQCDVISSGIAKECLKYPWDSEQLMQLTIQEVLIKKIKCVQNKMPKWTSEQQLQGGIAAYNFGCSNVRSWDNLDKGTANGDYSNDIIARAQWIKRQPLAWNIKL